MDSSARTPGPVRQPAPDCRCRQSSSRGIRTRQRFGQKEKTNPIEPIEVKCWCFKQMREIFRNRSHWAHLAFFQMVTAKSGPISGNCASPRTRIQRKAGSPAPMPQDEPGMCFRFSCQGDAGAPTHQDSPEACSELSHPQIRQRHPVDRSGRELSGVARQQSRNVALFQEDGAPGLSHAPGFLREGGNRGAQSMKRYRRVPVAREGDRIPGRPQSRAAAREAQGLGEHLHEHSALPVLDGAIMSNELA
jgi:hypothetical protein